MRRTRWTVAGALVLGVPALAACGDDEGDDRGAELLALFEEAGERLELDIDRECVERLVDDLPEEDLDAVLAAGLDGEYELTEEGQAIVDATSGCFVEPEG